jgi:predicted phosphoribosyltransferase
MRWQQRSATDLPLTDRQEAGRRLATLLSSYERAAPVVLGLPRGGVVVAAEIATELHAPLDVLIVRKLGYPRHSELAIGAIAEGGYRWVDENLIATDRVAAAGLADVIAREEAELARRVDRYRGGRDRVPLAGRTAVVVDDGLATGWTARVALEAVRAAGANRIVLAVPVAPPSAIPALQEAADEVVVLSAPTPFAAISQWYQDFRQVGDDEVLALLAAHRRDT